MSHATSNLVRPMQTWREAGRLQQSTSTTVHLHQAACAALDSCRISTVQHAIEMDDTSAAMFSELLTALRGDGAVGTTALECKRMAPAVLADIQEVCISHARCC